MRAEKAELADIFNAGIAGIAGATVGAGHGPAYGPRGGNDRKRLMIVWRL
jgi:hypothetical protein